jgi:hypothetical protein
LHLFGKKTHDATFFIIILSYLYGTNQVRFVKLLLQMQKLLFLSLFIIFIFACEKISEDKDPNIVVVTPQVPSGSNTVESNQSVFYTWQGNDVVVDISTLENISNVSSITIIEQPKYGTAAFTGNLLYYSPDESIIEAEDQTIIEIKMNNKATVKEVYSFKIKAKNSDIPCHTGALPDKFEIDDAKSSILDVLKNDKLCDVTSLIPSSLKVIVAPKKGIAKVQNDKIEFQPNSNFDKGNDLFVYQFAVKSNEGNILLRSAICNISITEKNNSGCKMELVDDVITVPINFPFDTILIRPLDNDKLCAPANTGKLEIVQNPKFGTILSVINNTIEYKRPKTGAGQGGSPPIDVIEYRFTQNKQVENAIIRIKKQENNNTNCVSKAVNDEIKFSLSINKNDLSKGFVDINVLSNDIVCGMLKSIKLKDIVVPANAKLISGNKGFVKYIPANAKFEKTDVTFSYEFEEEGKIEVFSGKVKIKFVD